MRGNLRAEQHARHLERRARWAEEGKRIVHLWPLKSIFDIAIDLDLAAYAVQRRGVVMGLPSRPIREVPGA